MRSESMPLVVLLFMVLAVEGYSVTASDTTRLSKAGHRVIAVPAAVPAGSEPAPSLDSLNRRADRVRTAETITTAGQRLLSNSWMPAPPGKAFMRFEGTFDKPGSPDFLTSLR